MKHRYLIVTVYFFVFMAIFSCKKAEIPVYSGEKQIQFIDTIPQGFTFLYHPSGVLQDTVWLPFRVIGGTSSTERFIKVKQVQEFRDSLIYNDAKEVIDKKKVPVEFTAIPGKHYVGFDQPEIQKLLVIKPGQVEALLPVILLRDPNLKNNSYRLRLTFENNNEFTLGNKILVEKLIIFSDRFERFYSWRFDNYIAAAFNSFGKYSQRKHAFMYEIIGEPITEEWYIEVVREGSQNHFRNILREALANFNTNPENIASKKAPLRETEDEKSPIITF